MSITEKIVAPTYALLVASGVATTLVASATTASAQESPAYTCDYVDQTGFGSGDCAVTAGNLPSQGQVGEGFYLYGRSGNGEYSCLDGYAQLPRNVWGKDCVGP